MFSQWMLFPKFFAIRPKTATSLPSGVVEFRGQEAQGIWSAHSEIATPAIAAALAEGLRGFRPRALIEHPAPFQNFVWNNGTTFSGGPPPRSYDLGFSIELQRVERLPRSSTENARIVGKLEASLHYESRTVLGRDSLIDPLLRGNGVIPALSWNRAVLLQSLGFTRIIGVLGRETGAFVWSRFGYRLAQGAVDAAVTHVRRRLRSTDTEHIAPHERADVETLLNGADEDLAYRIASLSYTLSGRPLGWSLLYRANLAAEFDLVEGSVSWARARQYRRLG